MNGCVRYFFLSDFATQNSSMLFKKLLAYVTEFLIDATEISFSRNWEFRINVIVECFFFCANWGAAIKETSDLMGSCHCRP